MVLITVLSLISFKENTISVTIPFFDKLVHLFFYFTASALGCMFFRELSRGKISKKKVFWITPVLLVIYGIIIEVIQGSFTSYRSAEPLDVLANTLGAVLGTLFIKALFSERSQLKWEN